MPALPQQGAPAADSGVALASAVGPDFNLTAICCHVFYTCIVCLMIGGFARARRERCVCAYPLYAKIGVARSEEHTSELQSLMRISYAVFCLKKKKNKIKIRKNEKQEQQKKRKKKNEEIRKRHNTRLRTKLNATRRHYKK